MILVTYFLAVIIFCCSPIKASILASPLSTSHDTNNTSPPDSTTTNITTTASRITSLGLNLRILPLGASITLGIASTGLNGYRLDLQNLLGGTSLLYVGSQRNGTFANNRHEGHPGAVIHQVAAYAKLSLPDRPNVVLVHVGTNDLIPFPAANGLPYAEAPDRLGILVDEVVAACPDATVLVSQLLPARDKGINSRIATFNAAIPAMVANRTEKGQKVGIVDFSVVPVGLLSPDGIHPTDAGYAAMAQLWLEGIKKSFDRGWVRDPVVVVVNEDL